MAVFKLDATNIPANTRSSKHNIRLWDWPTAGTVQTKPNPIANPRYSEQAYLSKRLGIFIKRSLHEVYKIDGQKYVRGRSY